MKASQSGFTPRAKHRTDDANAFLPDPEDGPARTSDDLAESLAENFVQAATTGESREDDALDARVAEEIGGPFVETDIDDEVAFDEDESNPSDAEPAGLPLAVGGLVVESTVEQDLDRAAAAGEDEDEDDEEDEEDDEDDDDEESETPAPVAVVEDADM